jgi:hypothetical protein
VKHYEPIEEVDTIYCDALCCTWGRITRRCRQYWSLAERPGYCGSDIDHKINMLQKEIEYKDRPWMYKSLELLTKKKECL